VPDRITTLETQVHHLLTKQTQMETHFGEFSAQQTQQVSMLQSQVNANAQQVHGQLEQQNQSIQAMFETQLAHIRGLLSKRSREDGE
jgi:ribosomal protein L16 Arg81 hydroxylase